MKRLYGTLLGAILTLPGIVQAQNPTDPMRTAKHTTDYQLLQDKTANQAIKQIKRVRGHIKLASAFQALALIPENFTYDGSGKKQADFWLRSAEDLARTGRALGKAILYLTEKMEKGPVETALTIAGTQLTELRAGSKGDVYYWNQRTKELTEQIQTATDQIIRLSNAMDDEKTNISSAIIALSIVITSNNAEGYGDIHYWSRAAINMAEVSHGCGSALEFIARPIPEPLFTVLSTYVDQLNKVSAKGNGDLNYWMKRTKDLREQVDNIGLSLLDISKQV